MTLKVLIVDHSETDRASLQKIIARAGHAAIVADSSEEGLRQAAMERPDLVFMAVNLPGLDGFACARKLHEDPRTQSIPLVLVASTASNADKVWAQIVGARGYVLKPYKEEEIRAELAMS